jgi:acetylglutamate kinase
MPTQSTLAALRTAIPYIRAYKGQVFVVKLSGRLCDGPPLANLVDQLALLSQLGIRIIVVHGGGDQVTALSQRMGLVPEIVGGRRVTDAETLEVAKMVFAGTVNTNLIAAFRAASVPAVGLTGCDGGLATVVRRLPKTITDDSGEQRTVDYGFVGDITRVNPAVLEHLLQGGYMPVVASLAADIAGQIYNINADTLAAGVAIATKAAKYFLLTTVDGVMSDVHAPASLHSYLDLAQLDELIRQGVITGGMLPKLAACREALQGGVPRIHIVNGAVPDTLLSEVFTNEGCGTLIVAQRGEA